MRIDLARRYKRWRHGRGFGIHSPFAFDFITRTLRERLPYYAYNRLDAVASAQHLSSAERRRLRLIFRIAVRFNPTAVAIIGNRNDGPLKVALKSVRRDMNVHSPLSEAQLLIVTDDIAGDLPAISDTAVCIFPATDRGGASICESIWQSTLRGMRFDNSRGFAVIVRSPALPRQRFDVRF